MDLELLSIVGLIYDAAIDPSGWHNAIDAVRGRLGFYNSMMTLGDLETGRAIVSVKVNIPEAYDAMETPEYMESMIGLWGGPDALAKHIIEEPMILSEASDPTWWDANPYYNDFAKPQGIFDVTAVALVRDRKLAGDLGFGRHRSAGRVTRAQIDELRVLAPHIRRAALISGILDNRGAAAATFEAAIDATPAGVVLVDRDMRIVHSNQAASRMLADADPIRQVGGKLELRAELMRGQLAAAVAGAAEGPTALGRRGIGISARRNDGTPLVVHVMPLNTRQSNTPLLGNAIAAVFIAESGATSHVADALGMLYGLTPMQARVFELVTAGLTSVNIATTLGIAPSTFKSHLLQVYEKTGRNRRRDLVALAKDIF
ncbi:MAG: LuxR C-terminal-related transcriptional regulator [Devosia sp.]